MSAAAAHPLWEGAGLTFERLGLTPGLWEPMPPPSGGVPLVLQYAVLREERSKDMEWCERELQALAPQSEGRREPPRYGDCSECGWKHALIEEGGAE